MQIATIDEQDTGNVSLRRSLSYLYYVWRLLSLFWFCSFFFKVFHPKAKQSLLPLPLFIRRGGLSPPAPKFSLWSSFCCYLEVEQKRSKNFQPNRIDTLLFGKKKGGLFNCSLKIYMEALYSSKHLSGLFR